MRKTNSKIQMLAGKNLNSCPDSDSDETLTLVVYQFFFLIFQTIHLKALGFTIEDASIVNSVIPGADIFGPPLAGFLADKLGNFRIFMALLTFFNGASSLLLLAIPSMMTSSSSESEAESIFQHEETFTNLTTSTNLTPFNNATLGVNQVKVYYNIRQ